MILLFKCLFTKSWTSNAIKQDEFITIEVLFFPLFNCSLENLCALSIKHSSWTLICLHSLSKRHCSRSQEISERPTGKGNNHRQEIKLLKKWETDCQRAASGWSQWGKVSAGRRGTGLSLRNRTPLKARGTGGAKHRTTGWNLFKGE